jgi:polar amino acid transport system substrate-binding protein
MKKIITLIAWVAFAVSLGAGSPGAETIRIGTFPIPLMVIDKDNGVFIELTKTIAERAGLQVEITVIPPKRAINDFSEKQMDVLFPALDVNFSPEKMPLKSSELIYVKKDFVFTPKGSALLATLKDLEGKTVGITLGYPYVRELTENPLIRIESAQSDELSAKMLEAGRTQAFVVEEKSGLKAFENTGLKDKIQYDPSRPLSQQDVYYAFQKDEKGENLDRIFSKTLAEMKQDGTFAKIMQKAEMQK